jgi:hypothetical protein
VNEAARPQATIIRFVDSRWTLWIASACSFTLGMFFVFVWSPLPWGWLGIDHYDDRAVRLAAGGSFDTTDVPWGYAYYLAAFYRVFGHVPVAPLIGQVALNATLPWLIFAIARPYVGKRTAALTALLTGLCSFNTVYASTQSTDSVCTVLFAALMLAYLRGRNSDRLSSFAMAGVLAGLAAQFRPNLVLFPLVLAAIELLTSNPLSRRIARAFAIVACVAATLSPWIIRNYTLTGELFPTSTHGGIQLWYGTLQVGPYLESRAHNPRSAFESPPFDYTSLIDRAIVVTAKPQCAGAVPQSPILVYWTDRNRQPSRLMPSTMTSTSIQFDIPGQPSPTAVYYYLEASWEGRPGTQTPPNRGAAAPFVYFVSEAHLIDLDRHNDLLDVFDLVRLLRWEAWREPPSNRAALDLNDDEALDSRDLERAAAELLGAAGEVAANAAITAVETTDQAVTLRLADGSWFRVPRAFSGNITDLQAEGAIAEKLLYSRRVATDMTPAPPTGDACTYFDGVAANDVFYRKEPHLMRRYFALAFDNINRDRIGFARATAYRMLRLFIIRGSDDRRTSQQFTASGVVYALGTLVSVTYFLALLAGMAIALRRRLTVWPLILPIAYVPLTIAPVLTNMRYTLTAQPFAFAFVAVALIAALRLRPTGESGE